VWPSGEAVYQKPEKWILSVVNNTGWDTSTSQGTSASELISTAPQQQQAPFIFVILCHHGQLNGRGTSLICTPSDCRAKMLLFLHLVFLCVAVVGSSTPSTPEGNNEKGYCDNAFNLYLLSTLTIQCEHLLILNVCIFTHKLCV